MTAPVYGDVFDHHSVVYEFETGIRLYAFCRTTTGCYSEDSSILLGSKGTASIKNCHISGETNWRWKGRCDPYQLEHDRLFASIRSGNPVNNGDYMARSTMTTVMGQISCYTGKEVTWEQASNSDFYYAPRPEDCSDTMDAPVRPGPGNVYPVPTPGRTEFHLKLA